MFRRFAVDTTGGDDVVDISTVIIKGFRIMPKKSMGRGIRGQMNRWLNMRELICQGDESQ